MEPDPAALPRLTDKYFLRTKEVVGRFGDRQVTYAIFMRRPVICTPKPSTVWSSIPRPK